MPLATMYFSQNTDIDSGADEQIDSSAPTDCLRVTVKALTTNSNVIYVGLTGVTAATGFPLSAGQQLEIVGTYNQMINAALLYARGAADNQAVALACIRNEPV